MAKERTYKTLDEGEEVYYRNHPGEIDKYLTITFEDICKRWTHCRIARLIADDRTCQRCYCAISGNRDIAERYRLCHVLFVLIFRLVKQLNYCIIKYS